MPVWGCWSTVSQECDAILKNRKRFSWNGKKTLTWRWQNGGRARNRSFFSKVQSQTWTNKSRRKWKTVTESLSTSSLIVVEQTKKASDSESALLSFIRKRENSHPLGCLVIWGTFLHFLSKEQLFCLQMRKFICKTVTVAINVKTSMRVPYMLLRTIQKQQQKRSV